MRGHVGWWQRWGTTTPTSIYSQGIPDYIDPETSGGWHRRTTPPPPFPTQARGAVGRPATALPMMSRAREPKRSSRSTACPARPVATGTRLGGRIGARPMSGHRLDCGNRIVLHVRNT